MKSLALIIRLDDPRREASIRKSLAELEQDDGDFRVIRPAADSLYSLDPAVIGVVVAFSTGFASSVGEKIGSIAATWLRTKLAKHLGPKDKVEPKNRSDL